MGVTFFSPNKKVTKEVGIGGGFLQRRPLLRTTPPKTEKPEDFFLSLRNYRFLACRIPEAETLHGKNRDIFVVLRM
jgi:hypothetical protein